jgi:hypothetical protein
MRILRAAVASIVIGGIGFTALAQNNPPPPPPGGGQPGGPGGGQPGGPGGPRGPQLSPEKAKAAWELQATGVSGHLGFSEEQTRAVVKAYVDARTSHTAASDKVRQEMRDRAGGGGGFGPEFQEAMDKLNAAERDKLKAALAGTLNEEQTTKALASLGTFNTRWDVLTDAVAGYALEASKQQEALNALEEYVIGLVKARESSAGDMEAMRTANQEVRQKLLDAMKNTLSEEQFARFEPLTTMGRRGGGPRPPGGGGGGGG